jgi:isocitrate/isopropylmalate dehydrogenase
MMVRSLGLDSLANAVLAAVNQTLEQGYRTPDIFRNLLGETKVGTVGMMRVLRENTLRFLAQGENA